MRRSITESGLVESVSDIIAGYGLDPTIASKTTRLVVGEITAQITLPDNATTAQSLTSPSVWDLQVQTIWGPATGAGFDAFFYATDVGLLISAPTFVSETRANRFALQESAYLYVSEGGQIRQIPFRRHIQEYPAQFQITQQAAADGTFALLNAPLRHLPQPLRLRMRSDQLAVQFSTAINWTTAPTASVVFRGFMVDDSLVGTVSGPSCPAGTLGQDEAGIVGPAASSFLRASGRTGGSLGRQLGDVGAGQLAMPFLQR